MRAKLTERQAATLKAEQKPYQCHDTEIRGLILRVETSGTKSWFLIYRTPSRDRRRYLLGHYPALTAEQARIAAKRVAGGVAHGIDPCDERERQKAEQSRLKASTLGAFVDAHYAPWVRVHLKSGAFLLTRLQTDFGHWRDRPLSRIDRSLLEDWRRQEIARGLKPVTVNRNLQRLQGVLSRAVDLGFLDSHPFGRMKPLRTDRKGRVRYLSSDEEKRLREALVRREEAFRVARSRFNRWRQARHLPALPEHEGDFVDYLRPLVVLAMNTGLRRGELLSLTWGDLDLDQQLVVIRGTRAKNGQTRWVPLNEEATTLLKAWKRHVDQASGGQDSSHPVFGSRRQEVVARVDTAWRTVRTKAGLLDFRFHDLRHHFASRLAQTGTDLNVIRELLGHSDLTMVLRYSHLADGNLRDAVARL